MEVKYYYGNYMSLYDSLQDAKDGSPKAEWNDIRCYVECAALESANAENERLAKQLIENAIEHPCYNLSKELESKNKKLSEQLESANTEIAAIKEKYEELKSYLPKVPTHPYEKELAMENARLRAALEEICNPQVNLKDWAEVGQYSRKIARETLSGEGK